MIIKGLWFLQHVVLLAVLTSGPFLVAQETPLQALNFGSVATQDNRATEVGMDVLRRGGNAIDAAYAIGYTMAVTHPQAGNIGGGGFMMVYLASENKTIALDYREKAPLQAHEDLFLDNNGNVSHEKSRYSALAVGVPGTVMGLETAHEHYGVLDRKILMQYAIDFAKQGFPVPPGLAESFNKYSAHLSRHKAPRAIFFNKEGQVLQEGDLLKQPQLAKTLKKIQRHGSKAFYEGRIAKQLVDYVKKEGGILSLEDLKGYQPVWREPVIGEYRGYRIASMPPPSSGGIALNQALAVLSAFDLKALGYQSADAIHIISDTLKYVYADRAIYLGDSDFVDVPTKRLLDPERAQARAKTITTNTVINASSLFKDSQELPESNDTTHFVVMDAQGNCVSNTYTLNFNFGNAMMAPRLGFLLNNEMDDFSAKPGIPNAYGLIGNQRNRIQPEKRMLSSMTPTFVFKDNQPIILTGSPGGSRIITTVLQVIINLIDYDKPIDEAVNAPRFHHQGLPDILFLEEGIPKTVQDELSTRGFTLKQVKRMGSAQSIFIKNGVPLGSADRRTKDSSAITF